MTSDLGLVAHAAQRDPLKAPAQGSSDGLADRGFADAGWPHEAQNRPLEFGIFLTDAEVLEDALFDVVEPVMIRVEDGFALFEVQLVLSGLVPR